VPLPTSTVLNGFLVVISRDISKRCVRAFQFEMWPLEDSIDEIHAEFIWNQTVTLTNTKSVT